MSDRRSHSALFEQRIDEILSPYERLLGKHYYPYANHVQRVANLTWALKVNADPEDKEKIVIAAAFHDIGIWTENTFDYLDPSIQKAAAYLDQIGKEDWTEEISLMIDNHHKLSNYKGNFRDNVESFRKADLIDLSVGTIRFGLNRTFIRQNYKRFPLKGFHGSILSAFFKHIRKHPFNPFPMMKF